MTKTFEKYLLYLLVLFLPSQLAYHLWPSWSFIDGSRIDYFSPAVYFTDLLILALISIDPRAAFERLKALMGNPYIEIIILLAGTNILFSFHPLISLTKYIRLFLYLNLFGFFLSRKKIFLSSLSLVLPFTLVWTSALAVFQFIAQSNLNGLWYWVGERPLSVALVNVAKIDLGRLGLYLRPYATFSHPNSLAGFLVMSMLILLMIKRKLPKSETILGSLAVLLTFSRTAICAWLLFLFGLVTKKGSHSKRVFFLMAGFTMLFLVTAVYQISRAAGSPSFYERKQLLINSVDLIGRHSVFGVGLGVYPAFSVYNHQPVHNVFFLMFSELGIPFCVFIGYLIVVKLKSCVKNRFITVSLMALFLTAFFDHYWITLVQNLLLLTMFLSLVMIFFLYERFNHRSPEHLL